MAEWISKEKKTDTSDIQIRGKTIPSVIVSVLKNRGYDTPEKIEEFFAPSLASLYDPFLINDMEKAVDRILEARRRKEKILVHGDYDTDGITGAALVIRNLRKLRYDVEYYIPRRLIEGYGFSLGAIDYAIQKGCSLIITVDCGIRASKEVRHACENNIDIIVCDHHKPEKILPEAFALLNPKITGDPYPFKELAGVGVAFKMLQALLVKLKQPDEELYEDLDLVALGSVVDVVPLIDENRILIKYGLKRITKSKKVGFQALLEDTGLKSGLTAYHLGFIIGPRINACGRLRDAEDALKLFLVDDKADAMQLARKLSDDNRKRQEIEDTISKEATALVEEYGSDKDRVIVIGKEQWHEGVVGIVASKISEYYYKPTVLLSLKKNIAKGSARSIPEFDITEALSSCDDLLTKYGGHSQAAGLEVESDKIPQLRQCINEYARKCDRAIFKKKSVYDIKLNLGAITENVMYFLKYFEPTGIGNPQPVFAGQSFEVVGIPRVVGSNHLKFSLRHEGKVFQAIAYGKAQSILNIEVGKTQVDCLYSIAEDSFFGKKKIILKIKEFKILRKINENG